jgi:hypothetical protein
MTITRLVGLPFAIALLLPQSADRKIERTPIERLQAKVDVVSVPNLAPSELAGQYTNSSEEVIKSIPPMGSEKLFVFPDRTYIFTFAADIPPETISDKGRWTLNGDVLRLESDKDVTWKSKRVERQYIVVRRRGHDNELFLVGLDWSLAYFEKHANSDPGFRFLLNSLKRERPISAKESEPLKKRLIKEMWQPEFYQTWFNQRVTWKYGTEGLAWRTPIKDPHGQDEYQLILQPLWAVEGGVLALEIVVARPQQPDVNILGQREDGIEYPFVITVKELEKGLANSKFGAVRTLHADDIALNVTVEHFRLGKGLGSGSTYCSKCNNLQELSIRIIVKTREKESVKK